VESRSLSRWLELSTVRWMSSWSGNSGFPARKSLLWAPLLRMAFGVNRDVVDALGIMHDEIQKKVSEQQPELERREQEDRDGRPMLDVRNRTAILIDDGLATGSSMLVATMALRKREPESLSPFRSRRPFASVVHVARSPPFAVCGIVQLGAVETIACTNAPPVTSTSPVCSSVALWKSRVVFMLPVFVQVPEPLVAPEFPAST